MVGRQSSWTVTALYLAVLTHGLTVAHAGSSFGGSMRGAASVVKVRTERGPPTSTSQTWWCFTRWV